MKKIQNKGCYRLFKNDDISQPYHFVLVGFDGKVVFKSENYKSKSGAINGIESCRENSQNLESFREEQAKDNRYYFNIVAKNGEIIGTSMLYATEAERDSKISFVHKYGNGCVCESDLSSNTDAINNHCGDAEPIVSPHKPWLSH